MYKWRHLIENFFGKLKEFKRIALRADKADSKLRLHDPSGRRRDKLPMNPNRP
jgi:transposase